MHKFESSQKDESKAQSTDSSKAVISNEGEIAPLGAICHLPDFSFQGGDFCRFEYTKILMIPKSKTVFPTLEPIHMMHFLLHVS